MPQVLPGILNSNRGPFCVSWLRRGLWFNYSIIFYHVKISKKDIFATCNSNLFQYLINIMDLNTFLLYHYQAVFYMKFLLNSLLMLID